ncbi:hypothetical protein AKO1_003043 [Acrasis kona]|uniref:Helicase C-terminal domain-containing protein n=1 Tax=Acrasis kona TaxID=1008807 RepID=A0AAW2ZPF4_9EUKA
MLPPSEQLKVFQPSPNPQTRLVIVATNVAETSLTIPGVRYVVDSGRIKDKTFDKLTNISKFQIGWTSKASSDQRAGRAGRTGPGHCYRLYSSAVFDQQFEKYNQPDILRTPIEGVVLQMKDLGIGNVIKFPFPTPPDRTSLLVAERNLTHIGALDLISDGNAQDSNCKITQLGREMNQFPLNPRYAKIDFIGRREWKCNLVPRDYRGERINRKTIIHSRSLHESNSK